MSKVGSTITLAGCIAVFFIMDPWVKESKKSWQQDVQSDEVKKTQFEIEQEKLERERIALKEKAETLRREQAEIERESEMLAIQKSQPDPIVGDELIFLGVSTLILGTGAFLAYQWFQLKMLQERRLFAETTRVR